MTQKINALKEKTSQLIADIRSARKKIVMLDMESTFWAGLLVEVQETIEYLVLQILEFVNEDDHSKSLSILKHQMKDLADFLKGKNFESYMLLSLKKSIVELSLLAAEHLKGKKLGLEQALKLISEE